ncbi:MAG: hypothetical protein RR347_05295 [Anaerovoracaceae bacterium]
MKKYTITIAIFAALLLCMCLLMTGCVSQSEYDELHRQLTEVTETNETLSNENLLLENKNEELIKEVDELKNGANRSLYNARKLFEDKKYEETIKIAADIHNRFNGSPEDIEAQALAVNSQKAIDAAAKIKADEEAALKAKAEKSAKDKAREIIRVTKISKSSPNSAGGVDLFIGYKNMSDKVIKYATFSVVPYNKVGDKVYSEIGGESTINAEDVGPHKKGEGLAGNYNWYWENAWYSWSIATLKLERIYIRYMDDTAVEIVGKDLEYVQY